jgi:hypothetical protein
MGTGAPMTDKDKKSKRPKKQPTGDYPVGYAKPLESAKWKPGQSGNPSGRPKKPSDPDQLFMKHAMSATNVKIGDQIEQMTHFEIVLLSLFQKAAKGDTKAMKIALDKYEESYRHLEAARQLEPQEEFSWDKEQEKLWRMLKEIDYRMAEDKDGENKKGEDEEAEDDDSKK